MDIPQAYRGRMFDRTGAWAFYAGGTGFNGPVLGPGTYYTGAYDEIMMIDCSIITQHDPIKALTKDGVQFGLDIYVRFSADCSDQSVEGILSTLTPDRPNTISTKKLFETYVQPEISAVIREVISPYRASEINDQHEEILREIRKRFLAAIEANEGEVISVYEISLSNLDFPEAMDSANVDRAVQTILRDKSIAERERVQAEIITATARKELSAREGESIGARIDAIGAALQRNPDYLQYDLQSKLPDIYERAGLRGNMIITAPQPSVIINPKGQVHSGIPSATPPSTP
jgi:regulator of protease activity HflC (stomatin/prohibitin superfamily)